MTAQDRKKLTQLSRRLKAADARYRSLEKRAGLIEDKRTQLEEKARRLFDLLMSQKGARAGSKRRLSLATQFKKAKDKAHQLRTLEDKVYEQLKEAEEKIATLEDNMRRVSKKNPGRKHLAGATAKQQRQYEHILESAKKYHRYGKRKKEVAARTVRGHANPSAKDSAKWEKLWGNYIKALAALDKPLKGANARMAQARLGKAERAIRDFDPDAYRRYVLGRKNPPARQKLAKAGRSVKRAVKATLDAGSKLLGAGAKALKNAINLKKFPDDKLQSYKADLESSLTKLKASGGGKATIRFVQGRINAVNRELKKRNPHKRIKVKNAYIDLMIKGQAQKTPDGWRVAGAKTGARGKGKVIAQGRGIAPLGGNRYLDKATGFVYSKRQRANPARVSVKKSSYRGKAGYLVYGSDSRGRKVSVFVSSLAVAEKLKAPLKSGDDARVSEILRMANPKRKRNSDHRDSAHQVKVHQHWRAGGLSQWQRAHHAGQRPLFEHGIKVKPKRNPSAKSIRKKFAGRVTGAKTMYYAKGAPSGSMAKLGKLASIKIEGRRNPIKPTRCNPSVDLWLCCDTSGKLWLASSKPGLMFDGPPQNLGRINEIEYVEAKPHLGNPHQTLYFHKLGEETGQKPSLLVDQHGDLLIKGGAYRVTGRGIEN